MAVSRGSEVFSKKVHAAGGERKVAARLGVTPAAVNYWRNGRRNPSRPVILLLREEMGIPVSWWFEPPRSPAVAA